MKDTTIIKLARLACGTALMFAHIVTGVDGTVTVISLFLMGVPIELAKKEKKEAET